MPMTRPATRLVVLLASLVLALAACGGGAADVTDVTDAPSGPATTSSPSPSVATSASASESATPTDGAANGTAVLLGDMSFSPGELTVATGTTVTFTNDSAFPHTVTHGTGGRPAADAAFDEAISPDGGTVRITFDEPGTYDITCKLHPSMQMRVIVEG